MTPTLFGYGKRKSAERNEAKRSRGQRGRRRERKYSGGGEKEEKKKGGLAEREGSSRASGKNRIEKCERDRRWINGPRILTDASITGAWIYSLAHCRLFLTLSLTPADGRRGVQVIYCTRDSSRSAAFLFPLSARFILTGASEVAASLIFPPSSPALKICRATFPFFRFFAHF